VHLIIVWFATMQGCSSHWHLQHGNKHHLLFHLIFLLFFIVLTLNLWSNLLTWKNSIKYRASIHQFRMEKICTTRNWGFPSLFSQATNVQNCHCFSHGGQGRLWSPSLLLSHDWLSFQCGPFPAHTSNFLAHHCSISMFDGPF
jgi:hypothetical protein